VSDGQGGTDDAMVNLDVAPKPNSAPAAADDGPYGAEVGTPLEIALADLIANDSDADGDTLNVTQIVDVSGGSAVLDGDVIRFDADAAGEAAITYRVSDGQGGHSTANAAISISTKTATVVPGTDGPDRLTGGNKSDILKGFRGNDRLDDGAGSDTLIGGAGDDTYRLRDDQNDIQEAVDGGTDTVDARWSSEGVSLDMASLNVERAIGSNHADTLNAADLSERVGLNGRNGDDVITGSAHNDVLRGGNGNDELAGGRGNDRLDDGAGSDTLVGGAGDDTYRLRDDQNDIQEAVDGGTDTVDARWSSEGVSLDMASLNVERAIGSNHADTLNAAGLSERVGLNGRNGDDVITGSAHNDVLRGGNGNDELAGGRGNDRLDDGAGSDTLVGGAGDDVLQVSHGDDVLTGGDGQDRVQFGPGGTDLNEVDLGQNLVTDYDPSGDILDFSWKPLTDSAAETRTVIQSWDDLFDFVSGAEAEENIIISTDQNNLVFEFQGNQTSISLVGLADIYPDEMTISSGQLQTAQDGTDYM
jgi:Ca2+-binding RTX toxin-like protein